MQVTVKDSRFRETANCQQVCVSMSVCEMCTFVCLSMRLRNKFFQNLQQEDKRKQLFFVLFFKEEAVNRRLYACFCFVL